MQIILVGRRDKETEREKEGEKQGETDRERWRETERDRVFGIPKTLTDNHEANKQLSNQPTIKCKPNLYLLSSLDSQDQSPDRGNCRGRGFSP